MWVLLSLSIIFYGLYYYLDGMSGGNYQKPKCTYELLDESDDFYKNKDSFFVMFPNLYYKPNDVKPNILKIVYFFIEEEDIAVEVRCGEYEFKVMNFEHVRDSNHNFINPISFKLNDSELCDLFEKNIISKIETFFEEKK